MNDLIEILNVSKRYSSQRGENYACMNLSFNIKKKEVVAIVGETGCGKSTTVGMLLGLLKPSSGSVKIMGKDPFEQFDELRGAIAVIFQRDRLLPWRTNIENVAYGLEVNHIFKNKRRELANTWLEKMGLNGYGDRYPHELSGGMRQRVAIARAFVLETPILLADESFSALDEITAKELRRELLKLIREQEKTMIMVTHSVGEAAEVADRTIVLGKPGHVVKVIVKANGDTVHEVEARIREGLREARS